MTFDYVFNTAIFIFISFLVFLKIVMIDNSNWDNGYTLIEILRKIPVDNWN
jgi:hypothetical protein